MICTYENCGKKMQARGLCGNHYKILQRQNALPPRTRYDNEAQETCSVADCDKAPRFLGYCNAHYLRFKRHGSTDLLPRKPRTTKPKSPKVKLPRKSRAKKVKGEIRYLTNEGYIRIRLADGVVCPIANKENKVYEHRLVLFNAIGYGPHKCNWCPKMLDWHDGLTVDHLDWDTTNNELSNLVPACLNCNSSRVKSMEKPKIKRRNPSKYITK